MPRLSIDTNLLIYAIDSDEGLKHDEAIVLVGRLSRSDTLLTQQVFGEMLNVLRKRPRGAEATPKKAVERFATLFVIAPTPFTSLLPAFERAIRFKIQFWDSLIITICLANGVTHLLSEDLQDGQNFDGLTILNPFNPGNEQAIDRLITAAGETP